MVDVSIGDSRLPPSPVEGGSWTAAWAGAAVQAACVALRTQLFALARGMEASPLANAEIDPRVRNGAIGFAGATQDLPAYTAGGSNLLVFALPKGQGAASEQGNGTGQ